MLWLPAANNIPVGARILARAHATSGLAPFGLRRHATRRTTLAAAVGMVARVHRRSTHFGAAAHPALTASFANPNILMVEVADLTDSCEAIDQHLSHFAGRHAQCRVITLFRHQLRRCARAANHHTAVTQLQLNIVYLRSKRNLFFFQAEDGIRDLYVTGVQTCALPI